MAYSFPLTDGEFLHRLPIQSMTFDLPEAVEVSETGGGELLTADLGTRLWQGEITLGDMTPSEAAVALALIDVVRGRGASFYCYDISHPTPRHEPIASRFTATGAKLGAVHANMREVQISGLPAGYLLQHFDHLAFVYGGGRHALHRVVSMASASGAGQTGWLEVVPPVRPGFVLNATVWLRRPSCKAIILPGSTQPGRRSHTITKGAAFKWRQTLR